MLLKSLGANIFNFQWIALKNASLRVYVGMMDYYGLCPMVIEHIAFDYYFFLVNRVCVSLSLSIFFMYFSSHLNLPQMYLEVLLLKVLGLVGGDTKEKEAWRGIQERKP